MKNHSDFAVHLHRDGLLHTFRPGDPMPDWAAEMITNPYVLGGDKPDASAAAQVRAWAPGHSAAGPAPAAAIDDTTDEPDADTAPADGDPSRPAESGVGSTRTAWEEYARSKGIEVSADWKREDIIAACAQAGH